MERIRAGCEQQVRERYGSRNAIMRAPATKAAESLFAEDFFNLVGAVALKQQKQQMRVCMSLRPM